MASLLILNTISIESLHYGMHLTIQSLKFSNEEFKWEDKKICIESTKICFYIWYQDSDTTIESFYSVVSIDYLV